MQIVNQVPTYPHTAPWETTMFPIGIVRGPHLIVMYEPTNHMDLPGILCLEQALADCPGAVLLVSHDNSFLEKITTTEWHLTREDSGDTRLVVQG